ncbi:GTPase Era [Candidatus Portiera aleyrodidarum]|uniref:GTPase Era n=1 Tax=Candidatus Portiera aleyrodidarum TaxID=91844 RepID=A0A8D9JS49_9GAMM|nr:GTPase Era [Candidatus Portiera aleyrodidarum]CEI58620.1 GTPase Era [Candidatus Portiera aleyrodidarum]
MNNICGLVTLVGSSNVGKSTLLNRILGHKISITSRHRLTTRKQIIGIKTTGTIQTIYLDTPGVIKKDYKKNNQIWINAIKIADCVIFVIDRMSWNIEEQLLFQHIKKINISIIIVINKIDWIKNKQSLLPWVKTLYEKIKCSEIIPISAKLGIGIKELESLIISHLPNNNHCFPAYQKTDQNKSFLIAELIREKIINKLHSEIPYFINVKLEKIINTLKIIHIYALIIVKRNSQKNIILGIIKKICIESRVAIEKIFNKKIMLKVWVKVK